MSSNASIIAAAMMGLAVSAADVSYRRRDGYYLPGTPGKARRKDKRKAQKVARRVNRSK